MNGGGVRCTTRSHTCDDVCERLVSVNERFREAEAHPLDDVPYHVVVQDPTTHDTFN